MSTTLTNGIIIPDNGSRNWGGDLANNWNIIDLNVGYMTDVKNRVTTLETSVAENTANIQTNASNISALQTSKQDVIEDLETIRAGATAGATAVQPSTLSDYVDLSSDQTITGVKTFSAEVRTNTLRAIGGGANISLTAPDNGGFAIRAFNGTVNKELVGYTSGMLAWDNVEILTRINGVTVDTQMILAKNLTGTNIAPGGVVNCENGNGKLQQLYMSENGAFLTALPYVSGIWKSTSFITISPNDSTIFIKLR